MLIHKRAFKITALIRNYGTSKAWGLIYDRCQQDDVAAVDAHIIIDTFIRCIDYRCNQSVYEQATQYLSSLYTEVVAEVGRDTDIFLQPLQAA